MEKQETGVKTIVIHNAFVKIRFKLYVVEHISYKDVIFAAVI